MASSLKLVRFHSYTNLNISPLSYIALRAILGGLQRMNIIVTKYYICFRIQIACIGAKQMPPLSFLLRLYFTLDQV